MTIVKLQRLYYKVLFQHSGYGLRNDLDYPFITESRAFFLVGLIFLHDTLDNLIRELLVLIF